MTTRGGMIVTSSARAGTAAAIKAAENAPASSSGSALLKSRKAEQRMISLLHDRTELHGTMNRAAGGFRPGISTCRMFSSRLRIEPMISNRY
jgi:hypothetical protein